MTANLLLRMTTTSDKSEESESGLAWKRFESGNVLTVSFWRSGEMTKNNKVGVHSNSIFCFKVLFNFSKRFV